MKKLHILLITYLIMSIAVIYAVFFSNNQRNYNSIEKRTLITKEDLVLNNNFINKQLQTTVNNLTNDQFPFKNNINDVGFIINNISSSISSKFINNNENVLVHNGQYYRLGDSDYYSYGKLTYDEEGQTLLENRIWNFERIYEKYGSDYKMYIYKPTVAIEENWFDNRYYLSDAEIWWNKFCGRLGDKYTIIKQNFNNIDDYKDKHYKTDHHWNYKGAYLGYCDIINMIKNDYEEIHEPYEIESTTKYDHPFYGSLSMNNNNHLGFDEFITYKLKYDEDYTFYIDGNKVERLAEGADTFNNDNYYAYSGFYGDEEKEIKIINNNVDNDLSILVLADSFSNCINTDLAAHFKTTYVVDTRMIHDPSDIYNTTFSLDDFLEEHDVDCILWLQYYKSLFFESSCYLHIDLNY